MTTRNATSGNGAEAPSKAVGESTAIEKAPQGPIMPLMSIEQAQKRREAMVTYVTQTMEPDKDYGIIPGTKEMTLLKPGAEKLNQLFGFTPVSEIVERIEDWNGKEYGEPFFYYFYRCHIMRGDFEVAAMDGSVNSRESRYRWRWVAEEDVPEDLDLAKLKKKGGRITEFKFAIDKAETSGQFGKPASYWRQFQDAIANGTAHKTTRTTKNGDERDAWEISSVVYRVPNEDIFDMVNTLKQIAQKRALVAATKVACCASEYFQDIEALEREAAQIIEPDGVPSPSTNGQSQAAATGQNSGNGSRGGNGGGDNGRATEDMVQRHENLRQQAVKMGYTAERGQPPKAATVNMSAVYVEKQINDFTGYINSQADQAAPARAAGRSASNQQAPSPAPGFNIARDVLSVEVVGSDEYAQFLRAVADANLPWLTQGDVEEFQRALSLLWAETCLPEGLTPSDWSEVARAIKTGSLTWAIEGEPV